LDLGAQVWDQRLNQRILEKGLMEDRSAICIKWLEYHVRRATDSLRPLDKYYEPSRLKDAM